MFRLSILLFLLTLSLISHASSGVACLVQARVTEVLLPNLYRLDPSFRKKSVMENSSYLIPLSIMIQTSSVLSSRGAGCPINIRTILATVPCEEYLSQLQVGSILRIRYKYSESIYPKFTVGKGISGTLGIETSSWEILDIINK